MRHSIIIIFFFFFFLLLTTTESTQPFTVDGTVIELDESNFDSAISTFDFILVSFYAPWCGHCKRLTPELEAAAPILSKLDKPVVIAKVDADKYRRIGSKYEIDGFPTIKLFMNGIPIEYTGPRKANLLIRFLKKFVAMDVSILESDSGITDFVEMAGTHFPIYIGFGLDQSMISEFGSKYKKKAWFAVAKDFSEEVMVTYDFEKVPALVAFHPSNNERSVFYGPFEENFLEDFMKQNLLPLSLPINYDSLKLLKDDERKIVLTIVEDESDEKSLKLIKLLKAAASANRDLIFGYVGVKQWDDFTETFDVNKKTKLPKMVVWDRNEDYISVTGSESLVEEDQGSQITQFLEGYREGRMVHHTISGPSLMGFLHSLISIRTLYVLVFVVGVIMLIRTIGSQEDDDYIPPQRIQSGSQVYDTSSSVAEGEREKVYGPDDKEE